MNKAITTTIPNRHGLNIAVLVEIPENPKGLLFIVHGFMSLKKADHIQALADAALDNCIIAVRFDATHSFGESEGSNQGTITTYTHDLEDVIEWAKTQNWYQEPFILAGHSLGGIAILEVRQSKPGKVKALAPMATVISGDMDHKAYAAMDPDGYVEWKATGLKNWPNKYNPDRSVDIPFSHMENRLLYNALEYAPSIRIPVFMIVGTEDFYCPPANQQKLFDAIGTDDKEYHVISKAGHSFKTEEELETLKGLFGDWLAKIL